MKVSAEQLKRIAKGTPNNANVASVVTSLNQFGTQTGLNLPHRLAQFIAQLCHESGGFKYDKELASGSAYEGRKDLGNTKKGDGVRFKGRGPIQITGRGNYHRFTAWVKKSIPDCPDFETHPELINTDPYEGLTAIWFWDSGNSTGKSLNVYADQQNIEMITRKINGGLNGYDDRLNYYDRAALVFLGYPVNGYQAFQIFAKRKGWYHDVTNGAPGPKTRAAMHLALVDLTSDESMPAHIMAGPVVETKTVEKEVEVKVADPVAVPVVTTNLEKPWYASLDGIKEMVTGGGITAFTAVSGAPWQTIAVIGTLALAGGLAFYFIRQHHRASQQAAVKQIEAANALPSNLTNG